MKINIIRQVWRSIVFFSVDKCFETGAIGKKKPEKIRASTGFEPLCLSRSATLSGETTVALHDRGRTSPAQIYHYSFYNVSCKSLENFRFKLLQTSRPRKPALKDDVCTLDHCKIPE